MSVSSRLIAALLARPVAYHPVFRHVGGSTVAGVFLSQMYYWSTSNRIAANKDGWFYKTQQEWCEETGLSRSEQDRARRDLVKAKLIEEVRRGHPAKLWFRLNIEALHAAIHQYAESCNLAKNNSLQNPAIKDDTEDAPQFAESCNLEECETDLPQNSANNALDNNSLQDSAVQFAESRNLVCRIPQSSLQNPAIQFAESCNLYIQRLPETTTESTSESELVRADDAVVVNPPPAQHTQDLPDPVARLFDTRPNATLNNRFSMFADWQPSERFADLARLNRVDLSALDAEQAAAVLGEFVSYWLNRPDVCSQGQWEHKLVQQYRRLAMRGQAAGQDGGRQSRRQMVSESVMNIGDTSW